MIYDKEIALEKARSWSRKHNGWAPGPKYAGDMAPFNDFAAALLEAQAEALDVLDLQWVGAEQGMVWDEEDQGDFDEVLASLHAMAEELRGQ